MSAMTQSTSTTRTQLAAVLAELATVLDGVGPQLDDAPTPCTDFSVSSLRQHVVGWLTAFTDGFEAADGECSDPEGVTVVGDGAAQVRSHAARLDAALAAGGSERPLVIGGGAMPGAMALSMILGEYQVHGWDLARASGQEWQPGEAGLSESIVFLDQMLTPDWQGEGKSFADRVQVPDDAPAIDKLVALTGRDPRWTIR